MDRQTKLKLATAQVQKREQRDTKLQETFEALYSDFADLLAKGVPLEGADRIGVLVERLDVFTEKASSQVERLADVAQNLSELTFPDVHVDSVLDERLIKNTSSPTAPVSITGGYMVDYDTGNSLDLVDDTGGTLFMAPDHVVPFATGSGVTPSDVTDIADAVQTILDDDFAALPTATENADAVWSDSQTYSVGEKGKLLKEAADNAELSAIK